MVLRLGTIQGEVITEEKTDMDFISVATAASGDTDAKVEDVSLHGIFDMSMLIDGERLTAKDVKFDYGWSLKEQDYVMEMMFDETKIENEE